MMWRRLAEALEREGFPQDRSRWYYVRSKTFPTWIPAPFNDDGFPDCESIAVPELSDIIRECGPGRLMLDRISPRHWRALLLRENKRFCANGMYPEEAAARVWRAMKAAQKRPPPKLPHPQSA